MKVEYCPMEIIVSDFYTKPLQGKLFRLFRNMILNLNDEYAQNIIFVEKLSIMQDHNRSNDRDKYESPLQECVEKTVQIRNNEYKYRLLWSDEQVYVLAERSDACNIISKKKP